MNTVITNFHSIQSFHFHPLLFYLILFVEIFLSHQSGDASGSESRKLAASLHLDDRFLRSAAHVVLFAALAFSAAGVYGFLGIAGIILWTVTDELTKPMLHNGRHFSWIDVGYNVIGVVIGAVVWKISCGV